VNLDDRKRNVNALSIQLLASKRRYLRCGDQWGPVKGKLVEPIRLQFEAD
jgi:hypothetical protein